MISRLIESQKRRFLKEGGIKEQMYKARSSRRSQREDKT
ncbi:four helix bundle suffix domain-containing protein [Prevotella sp. tf2-5]